LLAAIIEQLRALGSSDQPVRQRPCLHATLLIEFAELRHRLLNDPTTNTHAAHQAPVAVNLPVLLANRVAQVHAPSKPPPQQKNTRARHYTPKSPAQAI
jgi:hypothetical protein